MVLHALFGWSMRPWESVPATPKRAGRAVGEVGRVQQLGLRPVSGGTGPESSISIGELESGIWRHAGDEAV
jgi:hypothetical protein